MVPDREIPGMELDPRLTFETFVVGAQNRLAAAAARRAAELPGTTYNPLFVYSAPGLGKSHLLSAIGQLAKDTHPKLTVRFQPAKAYLEEVENAFEFGDSIQDQYLGLGVLIMDDVQTLAGHPRAQEMLLRTIDDLAGKGGQVVLASDRPPAEIEGLNRRLLSRFSNGLVVDIVSPDYDTRLAIVRNALEERSATLGEGVAEALANARFRSVRKLLGAVDRVIAKQKKEERTLTPKDLEDLLGIMADFEPRERSGAAPMENVGWRERVEAVVESAKADGIAATPILSLLRRSDPPDDWQLTLHEFRERASRMQQIRAELLALGNPWPETSSVLLADTERLEEAESLLKSARERAKPFPPLPEGPGLEGLMSQFPDLALKAAGQLIRAEAGEYAPLFVHSVESRRALTLLEAVGRSYLTQHPAGSVAVASVPEIAEQLFEALAEGVAGAWRERWWSADVLLVHAVERLPDAERAVEEFFHLCAALKKRGGRVVLAADRPPIQIKELLRRISSGFEVGLVVDLDEGARVTEQAATGAGVAELAGASRSAEGTRADSSAATEDSPATTEESPVTSEEPEGARSSAGVVDAAAMSGLPLLARMPGAAEPARESEALTTGGAEEPASPRNAPESRADNVRALREFAGVVGALVPSSRGSTKGGGEGSMNLILSPEQVVWDWPLLEDRIADEGIRRRSEASDGD